MDEAGRILLSGISGFIGQELCKFFRQAGYEVWGISREKSEDKRVIQGDLLLLDSTKQAFSKIPYCPIVIHAAALAHAQRGYNERDYLVHNKTMTENLIDAVCEKQPHFIFLSSVSVYGEDGNESSIKTTAPLRPATAYGQSKQLCETIIKSRLTYYHILRLAPVYDESNKTNIKKRVYVPGQQVLKMVLKPAPQYSLCHMDTLKLRILGLLRNNTRSPTVLNVADPVAHDQNILCKQFNGIPIPCPVAIMMFLYHLLAVLPKHQRYKSKCLFWKLFRNNIYE